MTRFLVVAAVVVLAGVGATMAVGQGTGGTVGAGASGTKTFEVRVKENAVGLNCVANKPAKCFRLKPRIANLFAGNGRVYDGATRVGTAGFSSIATKVGKNPLDVFMATISFNNKVDSITVMGPSHEEGTPLPYSIVGGTGAYAGARGTITEKELDSPVKNEFRVQLNMVFIP